MELCQLFGSDTRTWVVLNVQLSYFIHRCRMLRGRYLYIFGSKGQGHNWTLSTVWFWQNNLSNFQHTALIFHTLTQDGERKTPIVFAHADITPPVCPPYWITASGLYPLLPCKLAKFSNFFINLQNGILYWDFDCLLICIFNENKEEYYVKTSENDIKYTNINIGEMDKSQELYSKEGDNSSRFEGKTVPWEHAIHF